MLENWIQENLNPTEIESDQILLLFFYENESQMEAVTKLILELKTNEDFLFRLISVGKEKKLAVSCEISRAPVVLFWYKNQEVARFYQISSRNQMLAALESIRFLSESSCQD